MIKKILHIIRGGQENRGPTQPVKTEEKNREMGGLDWVAGQRVWKFGLH
jgi:hypothetical protein